MASVRKRQWKGRKGRLNVAWQVDYRDKLGHRRARQFPSKAEATAWASRTNLEAVETERPPTFSDAANAWLDRGEAEGLEPATMANYRWAVSYLLPTFGEMRLDRITAQMLVDHRKDLIGTKSESLARRVIACAKMILRYANSSGMTDRFVAAAMKVTRSARHRKRPVIPTRDEIGKILKAAKIRRGPKRHPLAPQRDHVMYSTMSETGIRPCEARALSWDEVHFEELEIEILRDAKRNGKIGPCKTRAAYRTIPISPSLARKLQNWRKVCPQSAHNLVFPTSSGRVIASRNLNANFNGIQRAAGVTTPRLHKDGTPVLSRRGKPMVKGKYSPYALRHAAASWWIYHKVDLKRLTTWMGHASIQVTLDTYGHLITDAAGDRAMTTELAAVLYDDDDDGEMGADAEEEEGIAAND